MVTVLHGCMESPENTVVVVDPLVMVSLELMMEETVEVSVEDVHRRE